VALSFLQCDDREVRRIALGWVRERTSRSESHWYHEIASVLQIAKFVPNPPRAQTNFAIRTLGRRFFQEQ